MNSQNEKFGIPELKQLFESFNLHQKKVLTLDEVSVYTGLSKSHLYKLTSTNKIPFYKPQGKYIYFQKDELDSWLLSNRNKTIDEIEIEAANYVINSKSKSNS